MNVDAKMGTATPDDRGELRLFLARVLRLRTAGDRRVRLAASALIALLATLGASTAHAESYGVGQRVECDPTALHKYYLPGVVIPPHPGETYNGYAAGTGYFYRVRLDGRDPDGTLCLADQIRRPQAAAPAPAAIAARPAPAAQRAPVAAGGGQAGTFGTREPRTCAPVRTQPASAAQIATMIQCYRESKTRDLIYLMENIMVEFGRTRPYNYYSDHLFSDIDTTGPVLPIRGSLDNYQCAKITKPVAGDTYAIDNTGRNCAVSPERKARGICYRTTFGDWHCDMIEAADPSLDRLNQPPPRR